MSAGEKSYSVLFKGGLVPEKVANLINEADRLFESQEPEKKREAKIKYLAANEALDELYTIGIFKLSQNKYASGNCWRRDINKKLAKLVDVDIAMLARPRV